MDQRIVTLEGELRACAAGRAEDAKRLGEMDAQLKNKNDDIKAATKRIGKDASALSVRHNLSYHIISYHIILSPLAILHPSSHTHSFLFLVDLEGMMKNGESDTSSHITSCHVMSYHLVSTL